VQAFLARRLGVSRPPPRNLLDDRQVWVNRQLVWMAHHVVRRGDVLQTSPPKPCRRDRSISVCWSKTGIISLWTSPPGS